MTGDNRVHDETISSLFRNEIPASSLNPCRKASEHAGLALRGNADVDIIKEVHLHPKEVLVLLASYRIPEP
jgi:hypothetical protein